MRKIFSEIGPVMFMAAIIFFNLSSRITFSPLLPVIEADLHLSHAGAASFFLFIAVGYGVATFFSGFVSARLTHRRTIILSILIIVTGLLVISFSRPVWSIRLGLLLLGTGAGIYMPSGIATISATVSARNLGKALALHELGPNLALILSPLIAGLLLTSISWQAVLLLLGALGLLLALIFGLFGRGGEFPGQPPHLRNIRVFMKKSYFWIVFILFGLAAGGGIGVYSMLPTYLVAEKGLETVVVNTIVGLSRVSGLFMVFLAGYTIDRFGIKPVLAVSIVGAALATIVLGPSSGSLLVAFVFVQPILSAAFFPAGFAAIAVMSLPKARNLVVSLVLTFAFSFGGGLIPALLGLLGDLGSFSLGFILLGMAMLLSSPLLFFLRFPRL